MRNLALRDEPDYDTPPSRGRAQGRGAKAAAHHAPAWRGLLVMNWRRFLIISSAALLGAVIINALFFQTARHPAPLFAGGTTTPSPQPATPRVAQAEAPVPAPRPAELTTATTRPTAAARGIADLLEQKPVSEPKGNDPIAALLRGAVAPGQASVVPASTTQPADASTKKIMAAQKALAKLGYTVNVDGVIGSGTRQAIQKFERDRNLPQTGEIAGRTQRELVARSGIQIN